MTPTADQLAGWTPIRLTWAEAGPVVDWCQTAGERFDDPWFDQTVERCLRNPARLLFRHRTPIATVGEVASAGDSLPLAGLIFHASRCGSTLVSQMLVRLPWLRVMAEPGPLHSVLAARDVRPAVSEEQQLDWLRWTVAALGRDRLPAERRLVIKLDAWAVFHLPLLQRAFPDTPWIFLYRDPVEIMVSQLGHRGHHMIPGCLPAALLGLGTTDPAELAPEEYMAAVLGSMLGAALRSAGGRQSLLVNYIELPDAVHDRIAPWFGIEIGPDSMPDLLAVAGRDAKNHFVPHVPDSAVKQARAGDRVRAAVHGWAELAYGALESMRVAAR